jgi:hypothetical protein
MAEPPLPEVESERRSAELRRFLERFVEDHADEPQVRINIPALAVLMARRLGELEPVLDRPRWKDRRHARERRRQSARRNPRGTGTYYLAGDVLFEADGTNHYRCLEGIMRRLGDPRRPPSQLRASERRIRELGRRADRLASRLIRSARKERIWLLPDPWLVHWSFATGSIVLAHAEALLAALSPKAVVTAVTANYPPRALIAAARSAAVPSVYFPHAPVLVEPAFNDLPTDFAGLRGPQEIAYYAGLVSDSDRLEVVGNPSIASDEMPIYDPSLPPVLAPPIRPDEIRAIVQMIRDAGERRLLVSPHPRADLTVLKAAIPEDWGIWPKRTYDLVRKGPPMVIQYTSGVALEALILGIPTIDIQWPASRTTAYPAIQEPYVHSASSAGELREAIAQSYLDIRSSDRRRELRDWARQWCAHVGDEAAGRGAGLVARAVAGPPPGPIWDAWAGSSTRE